MHLSSSPILLNWIASGYFEAKHMTVSWYLFPFSVIGKGPTVSTDNLKKTSDMIATNFKGLFLSLHASTLCHSSQYLTNSSVSLIMLGQ